MKIKTDFVTNSSSTGFIFLFKHDSPTKELLIEKILKYAHYFDLTLDNDEWGTLDEKSEKISAKDVVRELERVDECPCQYEGSPFVTDDTTIKCINDLVESYDNDQLRWLKDRIKKFVEDNYLHNWLNSSTDVNDELEIYSRYHRLIDKGFKGIIDIGIGSNEGHIYGTNFAQVMDYEGRKLKIEEEDFALITECRR